MAMAVEANKFTLLGGDDNVESPLSLFAASSVNEEEPPSAVGKRKGNKRTAFGLAFLNSSKPQRPFDHTTATSQTGSEKRRGLERPNGNGNDRNDVKKYDGEGNGYRQNNNRRSSFRRNNGYGPDERSAYSWKQHEGQSFRLSNS